MQKKSSKKAVDGAIRSASKARPGKALTAKKSADVSSGQTAPHAKRIRNYKKHANKEISEAFPEIVDVLVERAKEGSLTHAKFLFDIGGVKDKPLGRKNHERQASLAEMLLDEVAKRREERPKTAEPVMEHETVLA